jgi:Mechanosensitive ion channel, conserved TM helix
MNQPQASISVSQSFQNLLDTVFHAIPKILVFLVILIVGWLIAKALGKLVDVVLRRLHFDRLAEHGVVGDALRRSNTDATALIAKIVYYAILLIALQMAFGVFGPNPISAVLNSIVAWLPKLIVAIIIVVIASAIAKVVKDLITAAIGGLTYGRFLASLASVVIIAIGIIAALTQIGIAAAITLPILYIALITVGAVIAIGVGGGLIKPMQTRWERMLTAAEHETNAQIAAYQAGRTGAMRGPGQAPPEQIAPTTAFPQQPGTGNPPDPDPGPALG